MLPPIGSGEVRTLAATTGARRAYLLSAALRAATVALVVMTALVLARRGEGWTRAALDSLRYGSPRTAHVSAFFGREPDPRTPTHVTVINLNRQILVVEIPGGDAAAARMIVGPYLFGPSGDTLPVTPSAYDIDGDGLLDLLLHVDREIVVYLNRGGGFVLPTPEERGQLRLPTQEAVP
ncbi:MAG TPA: hypothetical protein VNL77_13365 [Roseiflexaceae bacterium]|nr:hypothetical protein [Roseiflexaceae bacterium]